MAVGVDPVTDSHPLGPGRLEVPGDVSLGVQDQGLAGVVGADQVGGVAEALDVELLEEHARPLFVS